MTREGTLLLHRLGVASSSTLTVLQHLPHYHASVKDVWGERTPFKGFGSWPSRVDYNLVVDEDEVDEWKVSACVMCSIGCGIDIAVKDKKSGSAITLLTLSFNCSEDALLRTLQSSASGDVLKTELTEAD